MRLGKRANTLEIEWLMRRCDRFKLPKLLEYRFANQNRLVVRSTLDNTVTHANDF